MSTWREREPWRKDALCFGKDINVWFPDKFEESKEAKAVCLLCPVRRPCLEYALNTKTNEGVWGGFCNTEIARKGPRYLDQPSEFYERRRKSHLRVASNGRVLSVGHDDPRCSK